MSEKIPQNETGPNDRSESDVFNDIRNNYTELIRKHSLGYEVVSEVINDLESSSSWQEFAQKQQINVLRIEPNSSSEKLMLLVKEYYNIKGE